VVAKIKSIRVRTGLKKEPIGRGKLGRQRWGEKVNTLGGWNKKGVMVLEGKKGPVGQQVNRTGTTRGMEKGNPAVKQL